MEWIDELDSKLASLREREAALYYQADVTNALDAEALTAVAEQRRSLILLPDVKNPARDARKKFSLDRPHTTC